MIDEVEECSLFFSRLLFFFHFISLSCFIHVNVGFLPIFYFLML